MNDCLRASVADIKQDLINLAIKEKVNVSIINTINNMSSEEVLLLVLKNTNTIEATNYIFDNIVNRLDEDDLPF